MRSHTTTLFLLISALSNCLSVQNDYDSILHKLDWNFLGRFSENFLKLEYSIFQGRSALRDLPPHKWDDVAGLPKTAQAIVMLINGYGDAAHEVLLGVTPHTVEDGEFAASHRGATNWSECHPLSTADDMVHSILHRLEGDLVGEGGHCGWENAMYWAAGGPKRIFDASQPSTEGESKYDTIQHSIGQALAAIAQQKCPTLFRRIVSSNAIRSHSVLADHGQRRTVYVPARSWDPFEWIKCCKEASQAKHDKPILRKEVDFLQCAELQLILKHVMGENMERLPDS